MGIMLKATMTTGLTNPAISAETAVFTTPALSIGPVGLPVNPVDISGTLFVTPGTGTTGLNLRLRSGGVQIGPTLSYPVSAGVNTAISFGFTDTTTLLEAVNGAAYGLTVTQTGAPTAAGTTTALDIKVMILWHLLVSSGWRKLSRQVPLALTRA